MRWTFPLCLIVILTGCTPPPVVVPPAQSLPELPPGASVNEMVDVPEVGKVLYSVHVSENYREDTPAPLILLLHYGYEGAKPDAFTGEDMIATFESAIGRLNGVAIAPDVVGGDWTSAKNEQAAIFLVQSAMQTYNIDPKRVIVAGYSMGGAGTWFIASRHQDVFTAAIPIAAPLAGSTDMKIPVRVIHSSSDSVVPYEPAKSRYEKIKAAGGDIEFIDANGLGHYEMGGYGPYVEQAVVSIQSGW